MSVDLKNSVVIDNGTGFTKMGYAGNLDPDFVFPTAIADLAKKSSLSVSTKNDEYNYYIGDEAVRIAAESQNHTLFYPMQKGIVENWDMMEKYWHQSIYNYLKCDPQEHYFVLTEPPMNPPENRENVAEIFFETFNVPGLYIGVQAVFALMGCNATFEQNPSTELDGPTPEDQEKAGPISEDQEKAGLNSEDQKKAGLNSKDKKKAGLNSKDKKKAGLISEDQRKAISELTGVVVDSGDGVTHVVPICDGYVLGSNIKHIPIAGRSITKFMEQMIRERAEPIKTEDLYLATMDLKEKHGYVADDLLEEYANFDTKQEDEKTKGPKQSKSFKKFKGTGKISGQEYNIRVGYELFLGPESFFSPEIIDKNWKMSLDETIDNTIQQCPIDYRRKLYSNIVMSGGSTQFKNFDIRLMNSLQVRVDDRLAKNSTKDFKPKPIDVCVTNNLAQKHVVWLGGSTLASSKDFGRIVHTREEYLEKGPTCCRYNAVFGK